MRDYFDDVPLCVSSCQLLRFVCVTAPQHGCKVCVVTPEKDSFKTNLEGLTQSSVPFPDGGVLVHIRPADAKVSGTADEGPQLVSIDCIELDGHDLGGFKDYSLDFPVGALTYIRSTSIPPFRLTTIHKC